MRLGNTTWPFGALPHWFTVLINNLSYNIPYPPSLSFFERISRTYRVEHFDSLLRPLLTTWCACARRLGDVETGVRVLVEGVVCGSSGSPQGTDNEEDDIVEDLKAVLEVCIHSLRP